MDTRDNTISEAGPEEGADGRHFSEAYMRQIISKISREELEDKYLRLQEQNVDLKKYARKQEEKIKKMATKLLRLAADKKKREAADGRKGAEAEEQLVELQETIRNLEKQNTGLKNKVQDLTVAMNDHGSEMRFLSPFQSRLEDEKLVVARQQLQSYGKRHTPYEHVKPKINTGVHARTPSGSRNVKRNLRVQGADIRPGSRVPPPLLAQPRYGHSLLEEARIEKGELEQLVAQLQEQIQLLEEDGDQLREQLKQKELEHSRLVIRMKEELAAAQRSSAHESVELIALQREIKDKSARLQALQAKSTGVQENLEKVKSSHTQMLEEMDKLNEKLKEEQTKNLVLKNEMRTGGFATKSAAEQMQLISDLKAENEILKEANEKLVNSAFDGERERQHRVKQRQLEVELEQLRATMTSDLKERNDILDKLTGERESAEKIQDELRQLRVQYFTLKEQHDDLTEKMKFFTKESAVDFQEIEEALVLIKTRKEQGSQNLDFLEKVDEEHNKGLKRKMHELEAAHADTINELEKTRNMLILQHKINKDYQSEVERLTKKTSEDKKEYDLKMQEYAQLLDIRAERIRKLEGQMRDVAYGTRQYKAPTSEAESEYDEMDSTVELERGQNLFEIHIDRVILSKEALQEFGNEEAMTFVTYEFFEHELQTTPVVRGTRPEINFTSQYVVRVDDFFLHYLQKETTLVELHRAFGTDYKTLAACQLRFRDLLEKAHGRIHASAKLIGSAPPCQGIEFATLEYWVRLRVPMDQAIRLYRERTKALGYMSSSAYKELEGTGQVPEKSPSDINELDINIVRCFGLKPRREGIQPCPYTVYRFYDFGDHDSEIMASSNSPEFNDGKVYPVPMTEELDKYLRTDSLEVYVFDDVDPEPTACMGMAKIPLISLANDKAIKGTFELKKVTGEVNGTVDVHLKWRYTYLPGSARPKPAPQQLMQVPSEGEFPIATPPRVELKRQPSYSRERELTPLSASTPKMEKPAQGLVQDLGMDEHTPIEMKRKSDARSEVQPKKDKKERNQLEPEKPVEDMSVDEMVAAATDKPKPQPRPRTRQLKTLDKPVEEMSVDDLITAAAAEPEPQPTPEYEPTPEPEPSPEPQPSPEPKPVDDEESDWDQQSSAGEHDEAEVAEEMRKTSEKANETSEDTMFEEERRPESDDVDSTLGEDVEIPLPKEEKGAGEESLGESEAESTESDGLVMSSMSVRTPSAPPPSTTIVIQVTSLTLFEEARVLQDPAIRQLFVSYKFLDCDPADLETPVSLPKPKPDRPIYYNFKRVFYVDEESNEVRRTYLAHMLMPNNPCQGKIEFTVVSDPGEAEEDDCVDVAHAYVDFFEILKTRTDVVDQDIDLFDLMSDGAKIGCLTVTVEVLQALLGLYR